MPRDKDLTPPHLDDAKTQRFHYWLRALSRYANLHKIHLLQACSVLFNPNNPDYDTTVTAQEVRSYRESPEFVVHFLGCVGVYTLPVFLSMLAEDGIEMEEGFTTIPTDESLSSTIMETIFTAVNQGIDYENLLSATLSVAANVLGVIMTTDEKFMEDLANRPAGNNQPAYAACQALLDLYNQNHPPQHEEDDPSN